MNRGKKIKGLISLLILISTLSVFSQNVVSDEVERNTLLAIYNNCNGTNWPVAKRWPLSRINSYPNPDSVLVGVYTSNGDIQSLQLSGVLSGVLPAEINNLTELNSLQITSNPQLTGVLPDLGNLIKLISLDLSGNSISGTIPEWIENLIDLQSLTLNNTQMVGPIPDEISALTHLTTLSLTRMNLSMPDAITSLLMNLPIQRVILESCQLTPQSVPNGFNGLSALYLLDLSSNTSFVMPDGSFPDLLLNLPSLTQLRLASNNLRKLPGNFKQLSKLNYLDISSNNFSDTTRLHDIVDSLKLVTSLKILMLTSCQIDDLPNNFSELTSVTDLYLNSNSMVASGCLALGEFPNLKNLFISNNGMTDLPSTLTQLTTLERLDASSNNLYPLPEEINNLKALKFLSLQNNNIQSLPVWFGTGEMHSILQLYLDNNLLTLPLTDSLAQLQNLTYLSMANNKLEGVLPSYFSSLKKIYYLNLSNNKISSPLPDFSQFTQLGYVYLQKNNLSGAVPATLSNNPIPKTYIDLSFNHFDTLTAFHPAANMTVIVNNNRLTFANILKVTRPVAAYTYIPQDTVSTLMGQPSEVTAYVGDSLKITASIDRDTQPASVYQWFKYVDGGANDIPLTPPSASGYDYLNSNFASQDEGKYYYKVTNPAAPGLTLVSPIIIVKVAPCRTDAPMSITYSRYVCAYLFNAPANSPKCRAISYNWNFGDNTFASAKNPVHGFKQAGTYTVSLSLTFKCGTVCQSDTTIQRQVTFDPNEEIDLFKDSLVQITSDVRTDIIATSVSTFSDAWSLHYLDAGVKSMNNFVNGTQGVWRDEGTYAYQVPRNQSSEVNLTKDGTFSMEQFNWQQAELNAIPNWIKASSMTEYSPFSYELENEDVLGTYSAALYDYGGHLPSSNGVNMRNNEMAFTSFEYLQNTVSGNWTIGTPLLPAYTVYKVRSGYKNMALVEARLEQVKDAQAVDVRAIRLDGGLLTRNRFGYLSDDSVICREVYKPNKKLTALILQDAPFTGVWTGQITIKNQLQPTVTPNIDNSISHSGKSSLHVTAPQNYKQGLIHMDSAKTYWMSAWVSVNDPNVTTPHLAEGLGIEITIKTNNDSIDTTYVIAPSGPIIEGWQQLRGAFTCRINEAQMEITFKPGINGQAWYDDLRLHPEKGNMKSYVYNLDDYRLQAVLDEENFASFYYYDKEGNLYLVKKETSEGVKTISENSSYQKRTKID